MERKKKKKGVVAYFMVFVFMAIILVFLFGFAIPMLMDMQVGLYAGGEIALDDAYNWLDKINDTTVKTQIQNTLDSSKNSIPDQNEVLGFFFQYSWIIIIVVVLFVVFMFTRTTVETDRSQYV